MSRTHKAEELAGVLHVDLKNKPYKELIRGLCGLKFNACVVFPDVQSEEVTNEDTDCSVRKQIMNRTNRKKEGERLG